MPGAGSEMGGAFDVGDARLDCVYQLHLPLPFRRLEGTTSSC